eukprot:TRINITY_DN1808_c0_g2_i3.p2 TRINITY_DN1808_c0_g2~~TRINITY_DN1808_c0_g2_i3.p2  ORF type:complete len:148 (+),score=42.55 TRINITY_DN1808_c0_g2_i3:187-630(+)
MVSKNCSSRKRVASEFPIEHTAHAPSAFLAKTYKILQDKANWPIVSWSENGKSFVIKDVTDFAEKILPSHFKHNNYASFIRQLNMYGFHKSAASDLLNSFSHPFFCRDRPELLCRIQRKKALGGEVYGRSVVKDKRFCQEYTLSVFL